MYKRQIVNSLNNLNDLVNRTTGIKVREEGGVGSDFALSIHGMSGNSVRYFLDGMPLDTKGSGVALANLPINIKMCIRDSRIGIRQFCFLTAGVPDAGDDKRTVQQWFHISDPLAVYCLCLLYTSCKFSPDKKHDSRLQKMHHPHDLPASVKFQSSHSCYS